MTRRGSKSGTYKQQGFLFAEAAPNQVEIRTEPPNTSVQAISETTDVSEASESRLGSDVLGFDVGALMRAAPKVQFGQPTNKDKISLEDARPSDSLAQIQGITDKFAEKFAQKGIVTVQDALFYLPISYKVRMMPVLIERLKLGDFVTVKGIVAASFQHSQGEKRTYEVVISDGTGRLRCLFFRFSLKQMRAKFAVGKRVLVHGNVSIAKGTATMLNPDIEVMPSVIETESTPSYEPIEGISADKLRDFMRRLVKATHHRVFDPVPLQVRQRQQLPGLDVVLPMAHGVLYNLEEAYANPLKALHKRLLFDELFYLQLALGFARRAWQQMSGIDHPIARHGWRDLAKKVLPFELTGAQSRVLDEIASDLAMSRPMRRLLQGDVGSGKTAVAMMTAALVAKANRQVLLLAPTEILVEQHLKTAQSLLGGLGITVAVLTGSTSARAKAHLHRALLRKDVQFLVGTHALLEPSVQFGDLGLVIVDEQHRFGVEQREQLMNKRSDVSPDLLTMTATPIPRTLTLSLYGDLSVSVLDELPPGRKPVKTKVYTEHDIALVHHAVMSALKEGRQAYVVYPLVEASDQLDLKAATDAVYELSSQYSPYKVGLLHGRMRSEDKVRIMRSFKSHEISVLVSTSVVEVGVDVPNATVMVVEEAERFGLSQLHQLRGRVGRGAYPGSCLLVSRAGPEGKLSIMSETSDGFRIAERDLQLRGPGEILGTRQSGLPDLVLADVSRDSKLLDEAHFESEKILADDPWLRSVEHKGLLTEVSRRYAHKLKRLNAG